MINNTDENNNQVSNQVCIMQETMTKTFTKLWQEITGDKNPASKNIRINIKNFLFENTPCFQIKIHKNNTFDLSQRSLGFQWFFAYILFTQFYDNESPIIFLFDEPGSNLHPTAQQKLLENFNNLVEKSNHRIIYSTHSHHLINLNWVPHTYIIKNNLLTWEEAIENDTDDTPRDIQAILYNRFYTKHPKKPHFYKPLMDALDVKVAPLDVKKPSLLVEGIHDYFAYAYFIKIMIQEKEDYVYVIPINGANAMSPIISILTGWGVDFRILLDGDDAGEGAKNNYKKDYYMDDNNIKMLSDLYNGDKGIVLENFFVEDEIINHPEFAEYNDEHKSKNRLKEKAAFLFQRLLAKNDMDQEKHFKETKKLMKPIMGWIKEEFDKIKINIRNTTET